ncbi:MAG TPA: glycoside hydrolase family 38 C-terminal domain-containing protein [Armatimonadota bacterium]|jgi:alpha-mannosidase
MQDRKQFTLHMIGNAHLDPVWLWDWREGWQEALDTCWAAVDRLREHPDFIFTRSSAAIYQWIEESDPELFAEIRKYVAEGRWEIVGGWWEQPDCNIPHGESFVRHALYAKRYFLEKFGVEVRVGYNPDSFGHNQGLPQILRRSGMEYYLFCRPDPHEKYLPDLDFTWQSPDGSSVLAYRPPLHYAAWGNDLNTKLHVGTMLLNAYERGGRPRHHVALMYGVGNHGGGPTVENLKTIDAADANPALPAAKYSRLHDFFPALALDDPTPPLVAEELQHHARGCYTSLSLVKWYNRHCEMELMSTERLAALVGRFEDLDLAPAVFEYPWRRVLFNQFHDIMGGCSVERAYRDVFAWYEEVLTETRQALGATLTPLCDHAARGDAAEPVLVCNTLPWARRAAVHVSEDQPARMLELPPLGWSVVDAAVEPALPPGPVGVTPTSLENDLVRVTVTSAGLVTSLVDKRTGAELAGGALNRLVVLDDQWDTWAHDAVSFRDEIGEFAAEGPAEVLEAGPAQGRLGFRLKYGDSTALLNLSLTAGSPRLDFELLVDWHEQHKMLKVAFPLAVEQPAATFEQAYTAISHATDGAEGPAQTWIDVTGQQGDQTLGAALLNDCKYGFDVLEAEMRMTITRSPIYAWHIPAQKDPNKHYRYLDQGEVVVAYALLPHVGSWAAAAVPRAAWEFNNPLITVALEEPSDGSLPNTASLAEVGPENVVGSVFKQPEEGEGTIVRVYESCGRATRAWIALGHEGQRWEFDLAAHEIKTLRLPAPNAEGEPVETDMLERPLG